ncbi:MAG: hypothetical protein JWP97_6601 [Labilithrix sp.]|nr:hypothetical protein [Labilithrix sp.]
MPFHRPAQVLALGLPMLLVAASVVVSDVAEARPKASAAPKPWCGPDVTELSDHVCLADGGADESGRHTLVIYLHGALAMTPGFQYVQQNAMALHAKRHHFTVVMPTAPSDGVGYVWPTSQTAQKEQEPAIFAAIARARADAARRVGHGFDETFVVGFSSGAYFGSSVAVRSALDVDGYIILAGGSSWTRPENAGDRSSRRAPVFVGVSAADPQTAAHSRAFGGSLASMGWPVKVEERNAGHMVDWTFMAHGISWLRAQKAKSSVPTPGL